MTRDRGFRVGLDRRPGRRLTRRERSFVHVIRTVLVTGGQPEAAPAMTQGPLYFQPVRRPATVRSTRVLLAIRPTGTSVCKATGLNDWTGSQG